MGPDEFQIKYKKKPKPVRGKAKASIQKVKPADMSLYVVDVSSAFVVVENGKTNLIFNENSIRKFVDKLLSELKREMKKKPNAKPKARSAKSGKYVSKKYAKKHPATTVLER